MKDLVCPSPVLLVRLDSSNTSQTFFTISALESCTCIRADSPQAHQVSIKSDVRLRLQVQLYSAEMVGKVGLGVQESEGSGRGVQGSEFWAKIES